MYSYFLSYFYKDKKGLSGRGNTSAILNKAISSMDDIVILTEEMKTRLKFETVVILNFQRFEKL